MIRYRYALERVPPAPFVNVSLACPQTGTRAIDLPAQVDTGADRTVLPGRVVTAMGLQQDGQLVFEGFGSLLLALPVYLVEVHIHEFPPVRVRAALGEREPHILLGRDVLNAHRLLLDGPQLALEIG